MAKSKEKNQALRLREQGKSLQEISDKLGISKSTISFWCRDVELSPEQILRLHKKASKAAYKGAQVQYNQRIERIKEGRRVGRAQIKRLSQRDLLLVGLGLYWGEGTKKTRQVRVSNSEPEVIRIMIKWFRQVWDIEPARFALRIGINDIHRSRVKEIERYWSNQTGIPQKQFCRTTLIKVKNKKHYDNFPVYHGTARLEVRRPAEIYYKIMGLIDALAEAGE